MRVYREIAGGLLERMPYYEDNEKPTPPTLSVFLTEPRDANRGFITLSTCENRSAWTDLPVTLQRNEFRGFTESGWPCAALVYLQRGKPAAEVALIGEVLGVCERMWDVFEAALEDG